MRKVSIDHANATNPATYAALSGTSRIVHCLNSAKGSLSATHPAHQYLDAAISMLGGQTDLTSPGESENLPSRVGTDTHVTDPSPIAGKAAAILNRLPATTLAKVAEVADKPLSIRLYTASAWSTDKEVKDALAKLADAASRLEKAGRLHRSGPIFSAAGRNRSFGERHAG